MMILPPRVILPVFAGAAALFSFAGCGGDTFEGSGTAAMGGTSGAGAQGGSSGSGASSGSGGNAGTSSGGSAGNAGTGSGGSAGSSGGSGGSAGSGGTGGLPPDWFACTDTSECRVREATCCQVCGPQTASAAIAFNSNYESQVTENLCVGHTGPCPAVRCALMPAYVLPFCIEGRCQAIDIRQDLLTSCGTSEQCRLRWGTSCCEACTQSRDMLVAVNSQVNYEQTVCGNMMACPDCAIAAYPQDARAECGSDHHCTVAWAL